MEIKTQKSRCHIKIGRYCSAFFLSAMLCYFPVKAQPPVWIVESAVYLIDGAATPYNHVQPGDTVFLRAGNRDKLLIRNFKGSVDRAITFMNKDGIVNISTDSYYGISIINCRYIRFSGQGNDSNFYGIQIKKVLGGSGMGIGSMSTDFEIDHVSIENCFIGGIYAKTDPDCSFLVTRNNFTQFNTSIHDNYIAHVGNEGLYIGSSHYSGMTLTCNGKDTIVLPPVLDGVKIYNNIVESAGWDGIQVSSAPLHCLIFNNTILNDSQAEMPNQMSGILMGGGSKCACYNNLISNGKGDGIENHGLGGDKIYNNIIVNAGQTYLPNDPGQMKHGIFVSDVSVQKDSAFSILFNDIINPKSDGIRFQSVKSKHSLIASNLILNPGNYNLYENDNTAFVGNDAFVMLPNGAVDVQLKNNFFSRHIQDAAISATDYTILSGSPLINQAYSDNRFITFDFRDHRRPFGGLYDIGAMEYDGGNDTLLHTFSEKPVLFPNPVNSILTIRYLAIAIKKIVINIYTLSGALIWQQSEQVHFPGVQNINMDVGKLPSGVYFYSIQDGKEIATGKFIKL